MDKKRNIAIIVVVAIVIIAVLLIVLLGKKDSFRVVKIYEMDGVATVTRKEKGEIEPYNNMLLESGDNVYLDTGKMTLKMDEDKYAYVEEKTEFSLQAEGRSENGRTTITITKGSITNEIQNKLSGEASYEVNTPNSTMAVRGTVFRVSTYYDDNGVCYTKVSVFEGEVTSRLVYPDGTVSEQEVSIPAGKEVIIYEDGKTTDYLTEVTDIDYANLPDGVNDLLSSIFGDQQDTQASEDATKADEDSVKETYVVTFLYNGKVFGTQQVGANECATVPSLMPAATGAWDFDFTTPITEDVSISWKE